jgi:alkylated DNA repair protein alkB homolog 6
VLTHRRLQAWPGDLTKETLLDSPLPDWLVDPMIPRILTLSKEEGNHDDNIFTGSPHGAPNHVLINEYLPGQGIMPHKDGPAYHPVVCTVSLGASLCLDVYGSNEDGTRESNPRWRMFQEPRSLLITTDDLYTEYLHGIADAKADIDLCEGTIANWSLLRSPHLILKGKSERQTRISLTYRDVLKVSKLGNKIGILGRR